MEKLELAARKIGLRFTQKQFDQFEAYYQEMALWNRRMNLTAITDYEEVQIKHFLDSLTVTLAIKHNPGLMVIDVGTGAGLPGVPIKILWPDIKLTLLDATAKKAEFLRHITARLALEGVDIVVGRAEDIAHMVEYREKYDVALSRAVATLPALVELCLPFCKTGGRFIAQKKGAIGEEASRAGRAISLLGGRILEVKRLELEELPDERYLIVIDKVSSTPEKYPRRAGMPSKRPIV